MLFAWTSPWILYTYYPLTMDWIHALPWNDEDYQMPAMNNDKNLFIPWFDTHTNHSWTDWVCSLLPSQQCMRQGQHSVSCGFQFCCTKADDFPLLHQGICTLIPLVCGLINLRQSKANCWTSSSIFFSVACTRSPWAILGLVGNKWRNSWLKWCFWYIQEWRRSVVGKVMWTRKTLSLGTCVDSLKK